MLKVVGIVVICGLLTSCAVFGVGDNSANADRIARCNELKHRIIFNGATNDPLVAEQDAARIDGLNRDYRDNGCS